MKHIDLFSGIGGFSYAFDTIFYEQKNEHIFVEYEPFCQEVLKKHWSDAHIHGDIKTFSKEQFIADARSKESHGVQQESWEKSIETGNIHLITGGFPCQPFSQAGKRKGTEDDRYLWGEMFRVIQDWKPTWVIAENVRGLATWNDGMVLEQVCSDLEGEGYEVQPLIIPDVAVNAPHRRDRIWFIAHARSSEHRGREGSAREENGIQEVNRKKVCAGRTGGTDGNATNSSSERVGGSTSEERGIEERIAEQDKCEGSTLRSEGEGCSCVSCTNTGNEGLQGKRKAGKGHRGLSHRDGSYEGTDWDKNWLEVATRLCRMDDGLPRRMDRTPRLKALGNAIVPQVAMQIMQAIKDSQ